MHRQAFEALLNTFEGCTFAGMDTRTVCVLTGGKKNEQQGRVIKVSKGHRVMLFKNKKSNAYEAMVKRRLEAEGKDPATFVLSERPWGKRLPDSPLVEHNGEIYLEVIFLAAGEVTYLLDGKPIAKEEVVGLKETDAKNQGLEKNNQVVIRTFKLDSIDAIRLMHAEVH